MKMGDRRLGLLVFLCKLDVLGARRLSYGYAVAMYGQGIVPPKEPYLEMAVVNLSRDFMQFVPKKKYKDSEWIDIC